MTASQEREALGDHGLTASHSKRRFRDRLFPCPIRLDKQVRSCTCAGFLRDNSVRITDSRTSQGLRDTSSLHIATTKAAGSFPVFGGRDTGFEHRLTAELTYAERQFLHHKLTYKIVLPMKIEPVLTVVFAPISPYN